MAAILTAAFTHGCFDDEPWPNYRRYAPTTHAILSHAPNADDAIPGAWRPTAILPIDGHHLLYLDRGTRKLRQLNTQTQETTTLADLAPYEMLTAPSTAFDMTWGKAILPVGSNRFVIASPGRPLIFVNTQNSSISLPPSGREMPSDGLTLANLDWTNFAGVGKDEDNLYLVFQNQVFAVALTNLHDFTAARLIHIAGQAASAPPHDFWPAREESLDLDPWTHIAADKGWIYFWDPPRLRAVKDDKILTIGGDGYHGPNGSIDDFYARHLPTSAPLKAHNHKLYTTYWNTQRTILEISVDASSDTGEHDGTVSEIPLGCTAIQDFAFSGDTLLTSSLDGGNFWQQTPPNFEPELLFGAPSEADRFESLANPPSPFDVPKILAPQSLITLHQGNLLLAHAPTLGRLTLSQTNNLNQASLLWSNGAGDEITHIATDGRHQVWMSQGTSLLFLNIDAQGTVDFKQADNFFTAPDPMGAPGDAQILRLTEPPQIAATHTGFELYTPNYGRILRWDISQNDTTILNDWRQGWNTPGQNNQTIQADTLNLNTILSYDARAATQVFALQTPSAFLIAVANRGHVPLQTFGQTIPSQRLVVIAGIGTTAPYDGANALNTRLQNIAAIAFGTHGHILFAENQESPKLWQITPNGTLQALTDACGALPPGSIEHISTLTSPSGEGLVIRQNGRFSACSSTPLYLGQTLIAQTWTPLDENWYALAPCHDNLTRWAAATASGQFCHLQATQIPSQPRCHSLPDDAQALHTACHHGMALIATQSRTHSRRFGLYAAQTPSQAPPRYALGNGPGVVDAGPIGATNIGRTVAGLDTDGIPNLYLWMRDTCSLWRILADENTGITEDTTVRRIITHDYLCDAKSLAVSFSSQIALIHDDQLYLLTNNTFRHAAHIPAPVIEVRAMSHAFIILTQDGIFAYERQRLTKRVPNPIHINGQRIDYAQNGIATPRMTPLTRENGVLLPIFDGNRIIRLAL